jgi:succinyl-CoA synthetase beta subunit
MLLHKSEHGGVVVGVEPPEAAAVYEQIVKAIGTSCPDLELDGVLVVEQVPQGIELLVGVLREPGDYPAVVTVGMGGTAVELYADVASALSPLDHRSALALLQRLKGFPLLRGYRGAGPADIDAAAQAIADISHLASAFGPDTELEINPLIVHPVGKGATAADFLLVRRRP